MVDVPTHLNERQKQRRRSVVDGLTLAVHAAFLPYDGSAVRLAA
jgi:hypothetical protein